MVKKEDKQKDGFPYWIHITLGGIWIMVGVTLYTSWELAIWVTGGLTMVIIGLISRQDQLKK